MPSRRDIAIAIRAIAMDSIQIAKSDAHRKHLGFLETMKAMFSCEYDKEEELICELEDTTKIVWHCLFDYHSFSIKLDLCFAQNTKILILISEVARSPPCKKYHLLLINL